MQIITQKNVYRGQSSRFSLGILFRTSSSYTILYDFIKIQYFYKVIFYELLFVDELNNL